MSGNASQERKLVVCVGNMLMRDEGFGPYMAQVLTSLDNAREHFDAEHAELLTSRFCALDAGFSADDERIPVLDAGTMGMSLIPYIRDFDRIVLVDVVDCGPQAQPGTCYLFSPEDMASNCVMHSLHDMKVSDVLTNARLAGHDCDIRCVGVQMLDINPKELCIELTDPIKASVPYAVDAILHELEIEI